MIRLNLREYSAAASQAGWLDTVHEPRLLPSLRWVAACLARARE